MTQTYEAPAPAPTTTRRPVKKRRTVRMLTRHPRGSENMVEITEHGPRSSKSFMYWLAVVPSDFGFAVRWSKFLAHGGEIYHTNIGGTDGPTVCDCPGHEAHGHKTPCKHIAATRALLAAGKL